MRRVAITGLGIVSSIGNNAEEVTASLKAGKSGIVAAPDYTERGFRSQVKGEINIDVSELVDKRLLRFMGPGAAYSYIAMEQAIADAGLTEADVSNPSTGLIAGSGGPSTSLSGSSSSASVQRTSSSSSIPSTTRRTCCCGNAAHVSAIAKHGPIAIHRRTFAPLLGRQRRAVSGCCRSLTPAEQLSGSVPNAGARRRRIRRAVSARRTIAVRA